jgi:hypothetical protein
VEAAEEEAGALEDPTELEVAKGGVPAAATTMPGPTEPGTADPWTPEPEAFAGRDGGRTESDSTATAARVPSNWGMSGATDPGNPGDMRGRCIGVGGSSSSRRIGGSNARRLGTGGGRVEVPTMSGEAAVVAEGAESSRRAAVPSPSSTTTGNGEAIASVGLSPGVSSMSLVGNGEEWGFWWSFLGFLSTRGGNFRAFCFCFQRKHFRGAKPIPRSMRRFGLAPLTPHSPFVL